MLRMTVRDTELHNQLPALLFKWLAVIHGLCCTIGHLPRP